MKLSDKMRIIKIGGGVLNELDEFEKISKSEIIVHGGSDFVDDLFKKVGKEIKRIKSLSGVEFRYTPYEDIDLFLMGMMKANKRIVKYLQSQGIDCVGLSGLDLRIIRGKRKEILKAKIDGKRKVIRDDQSGNISSIDKEKLMDIKEIGTPVLAPIAMDENFNPLNIDGDKLAYNVAKKFEAKELIFLSETALLSEDKVVEEVDREDLEHIEGSVEGGMKRKLITARKALDDGVEVLKIIGLNGTTVIV